MKHVLATTCGIFVFDEKFTLIDKVLITEISDSSLVSTEKEVLGKHSGAEKVSLQEISKNDAQKVLTELKNACSRDTMVKNGIIIAKSTIKKAVAKDIHISQAIKNIDEIQKGANMLAKRLREWYGYYSPEIVEKVQDHQKFAELIISKSRDELLKELGFESVEKTMGADFGKNLLEPIMNLAKELLELYKLKEKHTEFLEVILQDMSPNVFALCGGLIGAKLIELAGNTRRLAILPSSTIQTLGAEKALFRHLKTKARPPKHGVILQHPLVNLAKRKDRGRVARALANKISLAARIDYYGGDPYVGYTMREELEKKFPNGGK